MHQTSSQRPRTRRGFNIIELLIALAITASLLAATLVALDASYTAYQRTTRAASTHTISRIAMDRIQGLIRTGVDFGPSPTDPFDPIVRSNVLHVLTANNQGVSLEWVESDETLLVHLFDPETEEVLSTHVLLEGVVAQFDPDSGEKIDPFTLEFEKGRFLRRATIDLMIVPDDNVSLTIEGTEPYVIRLVGSTMPRRTAYGY